MRRFTAIPGLRGGMGVARARTGDPGACNRRSHRRHLAIEITLLITPVDAQFGAARCKFL